ncbi:MAG: lysylphosphatidylglycerol synthase transmembrane domain-containing protein [Phycisphaerales bacterium]|nr:lysylphosphatidylglycerol synthase transmembrane domain-containing protein [Phycisphaerales bacterium]
MPRHLFTVIRVLLVAIGVSVIALAVNWQTVLVVPAGTLGPGGAMSDVSQTFGIDTLTSAGPDVVLVTTDSGLTGEFSRSMIQPGLFDVFGTAEWRWLLLGLALVGCVYPLQATRWWILMRCRGLSATWRRTLRLVLVGAFCNFFLPGTEGGDVVKAWGAAKGTDRRVEAVISVVFDRITGLAGLVILAAIVGIFVADSEQAQQIGWWVGWAMGGIGLVAIIAFVLATRDWLRLPEVVRTFGGGLPARIIDAVTAYASHPTAVLSATGVSVLVQVLLASAAGCAAWSLGVTHDLTIILAVMPILFLVAAVPLIWQGAGVMELAGIALLAGSGAASVNQVVGLLLIYRALEFTWGGVGALLMLGGGIELHPPRQKAAL